MIKYSVYKTLVSSIASSLMVTALLTASVPAAYAKENPELIVEIDRQFRSSDRYIPANVLQSEAVFKIDSAFLKKLAAMNEAELLASIETARKKYGFAANQGVAENLLKIQRIAQLSSELRPFTDSHGDAVMGLSQPEIDYLVRGFEEPSGEANTSGEFQLATYELIRLAIREMFNNDFYNFKIAAALYVSGKHETHRATFSMFSRGKKNRPFIVAVGQDQVLDLLEHLHFTEREIQSLKSHPDFANVPAGFFDYLRTFKFRGSVRAVPVGTPVFANETIIEVSGNALEAQVVETLIVPIINAMSHFATKAARVVHAADGRPVVEGGTRRSFSGLLAAMAAYIGGTAGTSNAQIGRILKIKVYGSQNHASIAIEDSELDAHINYRKVFPNTSLLGDLVEILDGVRYAVRAAGTKLTGLRIDSTLPGMDKGGTARAVRDLLDELGYDKLPITFSDGLDEYEFQTLPRKTAPFEFALVGTEIAAPSDTGGLGIVFKLEQYIHLPTGEIFDPMKFASGKKSIPGEKQIYRYEKDGKFHHDVITEKDDGPRGNGRALLYLVMVDGKRIAVRESIHKQREHAAAQLKKLPARLFSLDGKDIKPYPVRLSAKIKARQARAEAKLKPAQPRKVGVYFGSFDPITTAHQALTRGMKLLYNMDEVLIVPTGDKPILLEDKKYMFTAKQRAEMIARTFKDDANISVNMSQVEGRTAFAIDTLAEIQAAQPEGTELYVIGGEDLLKSLPRWTDAQGNIVANELINRYNWVISRRGGEGQIQFPAEMMKNHRVRDGSHLVSPEGRVVEIVELPTAGSVSSTQIRKGFNGVHAIFHQVDTQLTFWEGMHGQADGPLAVKGTTELTRNVEILAKLAKNSARIKSISSKDRHYMNEVKSPAVNAEFHPNPAIKFPGFPQHAMSGRKGPVGDARIPEVEVYSKENQLIIPHNKPSGKGLKLVDFNLDAVSDKILDPNVEIVLEKNGPASYDVFMNPRTSEIYGRLNPNKDKIVFLYGVATDFCDRAAVLGLRKQGYEVYVISDAIAGVFEESTAAALAEMQAAGAKFVTTAEVLEAFAEDATDPCQTAFGG